MSRQCSDEALSSGEAIEESACLTTGGSTASEPSERESSAQRRLREGAAVRVVALLAIASTAAVLIGISELRASKKAAVRRGMADDVRLWSEGGEGIGLKQLEDSLMNHTFWTQSFKARDASAVQEGKDTSSQKKPQEPARRKLAAGKWITGHGSHVVIGTTFVEWADKTRWVAKFNGSSCINVVDESGQSYSGHVFVDRLDWDDGDVWFREVPEVVVNESNSGSSHLKNGGNSTVQSLKVTKYTSAVDRSNAHARKGHKTKNESHHQHHAASHSRAHSGERTGQQAESDCKDTADGAVVVMKGKQFDCSLYEAHPLACNAADFYDDSDFTAAVMCCSCGGGSTGEAHGGAKNGLKESSTISTTRKDDSANANAECRDTNGGAVVLMQGESYDCALYDAHPLGCKAADFYDDTDFTAGDMCCGCGGGSSQSSDSDTSTTGEEVTASQVAVQVNSSSFLSRK